MMSVAIDTDILIYLSKQKKLSEFVKRFDAHITVITEYEYLRGKLEQE